MDVRLLLAITKTTVAQPDKALQELKRQVRILLALSGRVLLLRSGVWLVQPARIVDSISLQQLLVAPSVQRLELIACFAPTCRCEPLSRQHLAAATHALATLEAHRRLLFKTPARWLGGARRGPDWLAAQHSRVKQLSAYLHAERQQVLPADDQACALAAWFDLDRWPLIEAAPRVEQLAWLCDGPPSSSGSHSFAWFSASNWLQQLRFVVAHGPRHSMLPPS